MLVVGIMCMGLLLLSTFLLYSISEQQEKGELNTILVRLQLARIDVHYVNMPRRAHLARVS